MFLMDNINNKDLDYPSQYHLFKKVKDYII